MSYITDLISNLGIIETRQQRYVAILDQNYNQILPQVKFIDVRVIEGSTPFQHTIESGSKITDYVITNPLELNVIAIVSSIDYPDVYFSLRALKENKTLLSVQSMVAIYENQFLVDVPHTENSEIIGGIGLVLHFQQAIIVTAQFNPAPKYPSNSDTVNRGQQSGTDANDQQTFSASQNYATNLLYGG